MSQQPYILSFDTGSTSVKAAVYNTQGQLVVYATNATPVHPKRPGESNVDDYTAVCLATIKEAVLKSGLPASAFAVVAMTGQMAGCMGIDKDFNPVTIWSNSVDSRHAECFKDFPQEYHDLSLPVSGTNAAYMLPKIKWLEKYYPETTDKIAKYQILGNYLAGKMVGLSVEDAVLDRTLTEWSGLADVQNDCWSEKLIELTGVDAHKLPKIVPSGCILGGLTKEMADACGLLEGTPVSSCIGDKPASNIGCAITEPGQIIDEVSTVGAFSQCVDHYIPDTRYRRLECIPSAIPGRFYTQALFLGSGAVIDWFKAHFTQPYEDMAQKSGRHVLQVLDDLARPIPAGSEGLLAFNFFNGGVLPQDALMRGMVMGQEFLHDIPHLYRAVMEGFGYEWCLALKSMVENYPHLEAREVIVTGGGARSGLYNQIKADILGIPYTTMTRPDSCTLGAAIIVGANIGIFPDISETAKKLTERQETFVPDPANHEKYKHFVDLYEDAFIQTNRLFRKLHEIK